METEILYGDLRRKKENMKWGREVMPKGERADNRNGKEGGRRCRGLGQRGRGSEAARLIAVDLHDKRSRQLVTKVALRH